MTDADHQPGPRPVDYDTELRRHDPLLRRACGIQSRDHVLDIGCGTGQTTRQAARTAQEGSALGIDVSAPAIEQAREFARAEGLRNVTFDCADAQVCSFPAERFDLAVSRFGTMFFGDPGMAFGNIRRALRPAGRLVMMVWQAAEANEWEVVIQQSLRSAGGQLPSSGTEAFSLADPPAVTGLLHDAGFTDVAFADVSEPVYYGADVPAALGWVRGFRSTGEALDQMDPDAAARAVGRLREALAAHLSDDGVWLGSRAWIVTARRR